MASLVFLRGVNVGGNKTFRPSELVRQLQPLKIKSIGAAGTFVVHDTLTPPKVRASFKEQLPFDANIIVCGAAELQRLVRSDPFSAPALRKMDGYFVSVLDKKPARLPNLPLRAPTGKDWHFSVTAIEGRFALSVMRRITDRLVDLNKVIEKDLGVAATTRNWKTILKVCQYLDTTEK